MKTMMAMVLVLWCSSAQAQVAWTVVATFSVGEAYYNDGKYDAALECFNEAWKTMPMPAILYDLALTHYRLDNVYIARQYLRAFMKTSHAAKYPEKVNSLANKLATAIDEDYTAMGMSFACDMQKHICGIRQWSPEVLAAWHALEEQATRR